MYLLYSINGPDSSSSCARLLSFDLLPGLTTDVLTCSRSVDSEGYAICPFLQQQKWHEIDHDLKTDTVFQGRDLADFPRLYPQGKLRGFSYNALIKL